MSLILPPLPYTKDSRAILKRETDLCLLLERAGRRRPSALCPQWSDYGWQTLMATSRAPHSKIISSLPDLLLWNVPQCISPWNTSPLSFSFTLSLCFSLSLSLSLSLALFHFSGARGMVMTTPCQSGRLLFKWAEVPRVPPFSPLFKMTYKMAVFSFFLPVRTSTFDSCRSVRLTGCLSPWPPSVITLIHLHCGSV